MAGTELVIFDLDGTLLDTISDLAAAANAALQANGFPVRTQEECQQFVGNGVTKLLERALPEGHKTAQEVEKIRPAFFAYYDQHLTDVTRPYPGMPQLLENLQKRGVKLAVASNKYQSATTRLVKHFFPNISFCAVLGQREEIAVKPDPAIVDEILWTSGAARENTLYVGDSDVDMQTAHNAGVRVCAVLWGFRMREELVPYKPDFLASQPADIAEMVA